jgi:hypothetical protein
MRRWIPISPNLSTDLKNGKYSPSPVKIGEFLKAWGQNPSSRDSQCQGQGALESCSISERAYYRVSFPNHELVSLGQKRVTHDKLMDRVKELIVPGRVLGLLNWFWL